MIGRAALAVAAVLVVTPDGTRYRIDPIDVQGPIVRFGVAIEQGGRVGQTSILRTQCNGYYQPNAGAARYANPNESIGMIVAAACAAVGRLQLDPTTR